MKEIRSLEYRLDGREYLLELIIKRRYVILSNKVNDKQYVSEDSEVKRKFKLKEVRKERLEELRESHKPGFILKDNDKYYYAEVKFGTRLVSKIVTTVHMCGLNGSCKNLSAAEGGCQKVIDQEKRIEDYPFISEGYQTINTADDVLVVTSCSHYAECKRESKVVYVEPKREPKVKYYYG